MIKARKNEKKQGKSVLVAFDRDGTLIYDNGYFGRKDNWKEEVKFYKGGVEAIRALNIFADIIVASNQIGVALGFYGPERVDEINKYLDDTLQKQGAKIDGWYFSPYIEKDWAKKNGLDLNSPWVLDTFPETRKPQIGMLKSAVADFGKSLSFYKKIFVVGDSLDDLNMALNANAIGIFFENKRNDHLLKEVESLEHSNPGKIFRVNNLFSAAKIVKSLSI
ncbi:MAG TPA: HAD-IIIA family hydrolase [Candidatus Uhrbacteria bacterium]|nr:HAD-IIIA family hydrolase [Candidatus Uhrbacteria bacterium]